MTSHIRYSVVLTSAIAAVAAVQMAAQPPPAARALRPDPALIAYTTFVEGKEPNYPADRELVAGALDRLANAIEGIALAHGVLADADFARIHELRRDLRYLAINADSPHLTKSRAGIFVRLARLMDQLDRAIPGAGSEKALNDALVRSADGLDSDYPLRWQPHAMRNYLDFASKALQQFDRR